MRTSQGIATTVTATEKWLQALQAGQCFSRPIFQAAVAAQFSMVQLFNPNASGKTVLVRTVTAYAAANTILLINQDNAARANLAGAGTNLLDGGAASAAAVRFETNAVQPGAQLVAVSFPANANFTPPVEWFAQLAPNQGLTLISNTLNQDLGATFMWMEF